MEKDEPHLLLSKPWVDHIHNPVDSQGRLRNVRRHHNLPAGRGSLLPGGGRRVKDPLLRGGGERRVERHHFDVPHLVAQIRHLPIDLFARVLNLLLSREKDEDVPRGLTQVDLDHRADCSFEVVAFGLLGVEDLDGVQAARDFLEKGKVGYFQKGLDFSGQKIIDLVDVENENLR
jgi:hypothetical protein